jgi:oxygen-independent coproporphyrinogen-3 oxidase
MEAWTAELSALLAMGPEHVSPYQLTIEAGTAFDRAVGRGTLVVPDEDLAAALFETTQSVLEAAGFDAYEVSNHARGEAARSRHNLVYWRGHDYVGVGPGAHGRLTFSDAKLATTARRGIADYVRAVAQTGVGFEREALTAVEAAEERLLLGLRIDDGVAFAEVAALGLSPDTPKVKTLVEADLLVDDRIRLRATRSGRLVLDRLTGTLAT